MDCCSSPEEQIALWSQHAAANGNRENGIAGQDTSGLKHLSSSSSRLSSFNIGQKSAGSYLEDVFIHVNPNDRVM